MFISYFDGDPMYDGYLEHHGILGMHWGIRRFQPYPKDYHGSGKEIGKAAKPKKRKISKEAKERQKMRSEAATLKVQTQLDQARAEAAKARVASEVNGTVPKKKSKLFSMFGKTEKGKQKAIRSGDPNKVKRYQSMMTSEEFREAVNRCDMATDLKLQELKKASKAGETIASFFGSAAKIGQSTISLQNSIADVRNALTKSTTKWKKWGEKDDSAEKAWIKREREWKLEEYARSKEKYEREKEKADRDAAYAKYKMAVEMGFDPDTGQTLKPGDPLYEAYARKLTKPKDINDFFRQYGYPNPVT